MKKILIVFVALFIFSTSSCNDSKIVKVDDSINKEIFNKNVSIFNNAIDAFVNEDEVMFMNNFADSLKWSGPDKKTSDDFDSKEDLANAINSYMKIYDDHALKTTTFYGGSVYSTDKPNLTPIQVLGFMVIGITSTPKLVRK